MNSKAGSNRTGNWNTNQRENQRFRSMRIKKLEIDDINLYLNLRCPVNQNCEEQQLMLLESTNPFADYKLTEGRLPDSPLSFPQRRPFYRLTVLSEVESRLCCRICSMLLDARLRVHDKKRPDRSINYNTAIATILTDQTFRSYCLL